MFRMCQDSGDTESGDANRPQETLKAIEICEQRGDGGWKRTSAPILVTDVHSSSEAKKSATCSDIWDFFGHPKCFCEAFRKVRCFHQI